LQHFGQGGQYFARYEAVRNTRSATYNNGALHADNQASVGEDRYVPTLYWRQPLEGCAVSDPNECP